MTASHPAGQPLVRPDIARGTGPGPQDRADGSDAGPAPGCHYLVFGPSSDLPWYEGSLRVERRDGRLVASGDLYRYDRDAVSEAVFAGEAPARTTGVPILPIDRYAYYLRVVAVEPADDGAGFDLVFEAVRYLGDGARLVDGRHWSLESSLRLRMTPAEAPPGHPRADRFFVGDLAIDTPQASLTLRLQMGWMCEHLRAGILEVDCAAGAYPPGDNGQGAGWQELFAAVGWDLRVVDSERGLTKADPKSPWTTTDAREVLRRHRDDPDLDRSWRYHLLVAPHIQVLQGAAGQSYHGRREGILLGSAWTYPLRQEFGALQGRTLDASPEFLRTAVHELGHAMGLRHDTSGFHFMRPTESIARDAPPGRPFPGNVLWTFDEADERHLRHAPDILVRPGGAGDDIEGVALPS